VKNSTQILAAITVAVVVLLGCSQAPTREGAGQPGYVVDPAWPKPLPNNWIMGQVAGLAVDARDHVWVIHRPKTLIDEEKGASLSPPRAKCCVPAPAVLEFDAEGNLLRAWGGPGPGYEWPENEHGIYVDHQGNVWVGGNDPKDHQLIKFTPDGKFLLQVGRAGQTGGSNSRTLLGRPAHMEIDAQVNELYIADGYGNKRVIVLDAATGAYKRHWGAYGNAPSDDKLPMYNPQSPQFTNPVHCVRLSKDGLVYVCDRANNRVQVFRKDGTFVKQFVFEEASRGSGSSFDLVFSTDARETYLYLADGTNDQVLTVERETGKVISSFGRPGRYAGQFLVLHNIGIDSKGNLYTAEVATGKRVQKFRPAAGS
jgi:DNA-binding beta-propeller fold protein YncE